MRFLSVIAVAFCSVLAGVANAGVPGEIAPQVGFSLTKSFGGQQSVPVEYGMKFHYGDVRSNIYNSASKNYRPALFEMKFDNSGLTAFETAGFSVMEPAYMLGASEEGFFSSINWGLVGIALLGAGIYYAAEEDRDDREERIAEAGGGEGGGEEGGGEEGGGEEGGGEEGGGEEGGGEGTLCDPSGNLGCSPVDPTADGGDGGAEGGGEGTLCDPSGNLGCSPVDPTADGGGDGGGDAGGEGPTGTPLDAVAGPVADAAGGGGEGGGEEGGGEPTLGCDPAFGTGQCI